MAESIDFAAYAKKIKATSEKRINLAELNELEKKLMSSIDRSSKKCEESIIMDSPGPSPHKKQCLRKCSRKKIKKEPAHTNGATVNRGMDEGKIEITEPECKYIEKRIKKIKKVIDLKEDYLRYLITVVFAEHLQGVMEGKIASEIHRTFERFKKKGQSMQELYSDVKTTLFTRGQVDYIQGCLQGKFYCKKEEDDTIELDSIDYISTVLFKEITIRIVMYIYQLNYEGALEYMTNHAIENADSSSE